MPAAIIIGATSGIGRALADVLAQAGYTLGLTGRRDALLAELQQTLPTTVHIARMDVSHPDDAMAQLDTLIAVMGDVELIIVNAGVGIPNPELTWTPERDTIAVNVTGFAAMAAASFRYFQQRGSGHLVGVTSIAGLRGSRWNPAYGASKAFDISYLEGLRGRAHHLGLPITVTDIRPGFVLTPMTAHNTGMFWVADPNTAARQIYDAIRAKKRCAYITRRWGIIAWLVRHLPAWALERM